MMRSNRKRFSGRSGEDAQHLESKSLAGEFLDLRELRQEILFLVGQRTSALGFSLGAGARRLRRQKVGGFASQGLRDVSQTLQGEGHAAPFPLLGHLLSETHPVSQDPLREAKRNAMTLDVSPNGGAIVGDLVLHKCRVHNRSWRACVPKVCLHEYRQLTVTKTTTVGEI